jgi:hypothetical protein
MMKSDYVKKEMFNKNFMISWREVRTSLSVVCGTNKIQVMTKEERAHIKDLEKCDFSLMTV